MHLTRILIFLLPVIFLSSCASIKQIEYFQDLKQKESQEITMPVDIKIQPLDEINIIVNTRDAMLTSLFNLPIVSQQVGITSNNSSSYGISAYTVDPDGNIDFPELGKINIAGKSRNKIAAYIKNELITKNLVKDPIVTVNFSNLYFSVLGEVKSPGRYQIDRDRITILDAISKAGDLTIYGERQNIMVLREGKGIQHSYKINLCSAKNLYSSPAYYLQQNDVIYVEPNPKRAGQSTVNGNNVRSTSFWMSLATFLTTVTVLVFK